MIEKHTRNTLQHEESGFTTLINEVINSIKHTGGLGVYCYLASKPAGWNICKKHLQNQFKCGRDHIETCFKYLRKIGAIEVTMIRDEKGRAIEWQTILKRKFNKPIIENNQNTENLLSGESSTIRVFHDLDISQSGDPAPINKRSIENKEYINNISTSDEVQDFSYTELDNGKKKKNKSDYENNHDVLDKYNSNQLESNSKTEKSDYFENQINKCTERKSRDQLDLKEIQKNNPFQIPEQVLADYIITRKKKRAPITQTGWGRVLKELTACQEAGLDPLECFEISIANGWGVKAEYFIKHTHHKSKAAISPHEDTSWGKDFYVHNELGF